MSATLSFRRAVAEPRTLRDYLLHGFPWLVRIVLISVMLWLALILRLPVPTFPTSVTYTEFMLTWPHTEDGWAGMFLAAALVGMPSLIPHRRLIGTGWLRYVRLGSSFLLASAHCCLAAMFYTGNHGTTGSGVYALLAVCGLYLILWEGVILTCDDY